MRSRLEGPFSSKGVTRPGPSHAGGNRLWRKSLPALLAIALLLRLLFFGISVTHVPGTGDEAMGYLLAEEIAAGARPLLFTGQAYQFPLEQYLLAPLTTFLPRNPFGLRIAFFLGGLFSLALFVVVARHLFPEGKGWPALLMLLFPSSYWLMTQSVYFIPQYTAFQVFGGLILLLTAFSPGSPRRPLLALAAGLLSGLAFSNHMLSLSVIIPCAIALALGTSFRDALKGTISFAAGAAAGLAPYFAAASRSTPAQGAVSSSVPVAEAIGRLVNPGLTRTLPGALGASPPVFPDVGPLIWESPPLERGIVAIFLVFLAVTAFDRIVRFGARLVREKWPRLEMTDVFVGISLLSLLLYALSLRSSYSSYRYLLPCAFSFPFLAAYLYNSSPPPLRKVIGTLAILLVLFNAGMSTLLLGEWSKPGFAARGAQTPDITPVLDYLDEEGIGTCYATLWHSYRVVYESEGRLLCSQPFNERFFGWPLPYLDAVNRAERSAYVLLEEHNSAFRISDLEKDMERYGLAAERRDIGPFRVYHDFSHTRAEKLVAVAPADLSASASHHPEEAERLVDGDPWAYWMSNAYQEEGMWIEIGLPEERILRRLTLFYNGYINDVAGGFTLSVPDGGGGWKQLGGVVNGTHLDRLHLARGKPVYSDLQQTIWIEPTPARRLRITISEPIRRGWSIGEVKLSTGENVD